MAKRQSAKTPKRSIEANGQDAIPRHMLPIPDVTPITLTTFDAKDPDTKYPPIRQLRPPQGAPNVLVVLIDDAGFGSSSAFGGPCHTPAFERLAAGGLKLFTLAGFVQREDERLHQAPGELKGVIGAASMPFDV